MSENLFTSELIESGSPDAADVRQQLTRMLQSRLFRHSPRLSRFFAFTVDQALVGAEGRLKEYAIALEVFGKPETFDPRMDSAVRVAARQLRAKIDLYYLTEGAHDAILIRYRPGDYIPKFYHRADPASSLEVDPDVRRSAVLVEKDRSAIRRLTDGLDSIGYPISNVLDSGERCLELMERIGGGVVLTGMNLIGSLNGPALTRALHARTEAAVIAVVPSLVEQAVLEEIAMSEPDAVVFEPVRPSDLKGALRIALTRRTGMRHLEAEAVTAEMASA
ncbi:MAG TPA: hypothetical protein VES20_16225 [Bryobacteraceae bacterium]|nr:hypothetical protein [Bryobacteraceae bacterium]